ncbi:MAG: 30S ribosomal protein S18 [Verrucomicrobiota bacterium]|nr:30S ribosomal protein S18 [Verrucomicrobiota bacterium]
MEQPTQATQSKNPSDYTHFDVEQLTRHVTDTGKILPRRITGLSSKQHRHMTHAVKRARHLLLMK